MAKTMNQNNDSILVSPKDKLLMALYMKMRVYKIAGTTE
jgi:hypothetical protein